MYKNLKNLNFRLILLENKKPIPELNMTIDLTFNN